MAAILKLLQTVDPLTRQYIRYYKISEIYEVYGLKRYQNYPNKIITNMIKFFT